MQHYRLHPLWTLAVFAAAFLFYALTACLVLYPGASAQFLTTLAFTEQLPLAPGSPLDQLVYRMVMQGVDITQAVVVTTLFSAFLGALTITCLFRAAVAGVRIACLDHATLPDSTRVRAQNEDNATALLVGLGVALMGLIALPMWATATRPLPGTCSTLMAMATLTLALGVRWRCALTYFYETKPGFLCKGLITAVFALAILLLLLTPTLLPVALLAILLSGWIIIQPELDGRIGYIYAALFGIALGAVLSLFVMCLWKVAFLPEATIDGAHLWVAQVQTLLPSVMSLFLTFEGICQLAFFVAPMALFFGCFPLAYLSFGRPLIGQVALLAILALTFVQWPLDFWETMPEPTSLMTCGYLFLLLAVGLLIGSWVRNWYDGHVAWKKRHSTWVARLIAFIPVMGIVGGTLFCHFRSAAAAASQAELETLWAEVDKALPPATTVWWKPDPQLYGVLLNRAIAGSNIQPLTSFEKDISKLVLNGESFESLCRADPVLAALLPHGATALTAYLFHVASDEINVGALPPKQALQLDDVVAALGTSSFATTPVGQKTMTALRAQIARAYVIFAEHASDAEAAAYLRRARQLDPENISALISIAELPEETGTPISEEEHLAAMDLIEHDHLLRYPTPASAHKLESQYGPVRANRFRAALRLHRLLKVDRQEMFVRLCDAYRNDLASLAPRERNLAILILPEEEAGQRLLDGTPTAEEVVIYSCAYPWTERSEALWAKYGADLLAEQKGLIFLRQTQREGTRRQLLNRAHTFFQDTKAFAYALFYVNGLIADGQLQAAEDFVAGFKVKENLGATPCLAEYLRVQVAKALVAKDATAAVMTLQTWLRNDPDQMTLWSVHLTNPALQTAHARLMGEVYRCLQSYPFHRVASALLADELRRTAGEDVAQRYRDAVNAARREALDDEDAYAHR